MSDETKVKVDIEFNAEQARQQLNNLKASTAATDASLKNLQGAATGAEAKTSAFSRAVQGASEATSGLGKFAVSVGSSLKQMTMGIDTSTSSLIRFNAVIRAVRNTEFLVRQIASAAEFSMKCVELTAELKNLEQRVPVARLQMMQKATEDTVDKVTLLKLALKATSGEIQFTDAGLEVLTRAAENLHRKGFGPTTEIMEKLFEAVERGSTKSLKNFGIALKDCKDKNENLNQMMIETTKIASEHPPMDAALLQVEAMQAKWGNFVTDVKQGIGETILVIADAVADFMELIGLMEKPQREKEKDYVRKQAHERALREFPKGKDPLGTDFGIATADTKNYNDARDKAEEDYYRESLQMLERESNLQRKAEQDHLNGLRNAVKLSGEGFHGGDVKSSSMKPLRAVSYGDGSRGKQDRSFVDAFLYDLRSNKWRLGGADDAAISDFYEPDFQLTTGGYSYRSDDLYGKQGTPLSLGMQDIARMIGLPGGNSSSPSLEYTPGINLKSVLGQESGLKLAGAGLSKNFQHKKYYEGTPFETEYNPYYADDNNLAGGVAGTRKDMADLGKFQKFTENIKDQTTVVGGAFSTLSSGISAGVEAAISGSESVGKAFLKASAAALKSIAIESSIRALYNTAMGFASLASPITAPEAAGYFKAAATFAATAAAAGVGSAALGALGGGDSPNVGTRSGPGLISTGNQNNQGPVSIIVNVTGAVTSGDYAKLSETIQRSVQLGQMAGRSRSEGNVTVTYE